MRTSLQPSPRTPWAAVEPAGRFLRACRRLPVDATPVWFMRQAGRALPEYRRIRERHAMMEVARTPELAAEVTLQPVRRLGVDAAILFADIVLPLLAMGVDLDLVDGVGPVIREPIRDARHLSRLRPLEPEAEDGSGVPFVLEAIRLVRRALPSETALIGFAGAPFTLASYLVEGRPTRDFARVKALMWGQPALWDALMSRLADATSAYLLAQVQAGADALQLFDSWAHALAPADYRRGVLPYSRRVLRAIAPAGVPAIHFALGSAALIEEVAAAGGDVIGVDWRLPLDQARRRVGPEQALQGNLDPAALLAPWEVVRDRAREVLAAAAGGPGHVFNLGHGVLPGTPVATLERLVAAVHDHPPSERDGGGGAP